MTVKFDSLADCLAVVKCRWVIEPSRNLKISSPQQNVSYSLSSQTNLLQQSMSFWKSWIVEWFMDFQNPFEISTNMK